VWDKLELPHWEIVTVGKEEAVGEKEAGGEKVGVREFTELFDAAPIIEGVGFAVALESGLSEKKRETLGREEREKLTEIEPCRGVSVNEPVGVGEIEREGVEDVLAEGVAIEVHVGLEDGVDVGGVVRVAQVVKDVVGVSKGDAVGERVSKRGEPVGAIPVAVWAIEPESEPLGQDVNDGEVE